MITLRLAGVRHSEYNHSATEPVHFLQIWIEPDRTGLPPGYEQRSYSEQELSGGLRLIASPDGAHGSVRIHQDARVHVARLEAGREVVHALPVGRHAWVQVARGAVRLNDRPLGAGDGAAISAEPSVTITGRAPAEILLFDLG